MHSWQIRRQYYRYNMPCQPVAKESHRLCRKRRLEMLSHSTIDRTRTGFTTSHVNSCHCIGLHSATYLQPVRLKHSNSPSASGWITQFSIILSWGLCIGLLWSHLPNRCPRLLAGNSSKNPSILQHTNWQTFWLTWLFYFLLGLVKTLQVQDRQGERFEYNFWNKLEKHTGIPYSASMTVWRDCFRNKFLNFRDSVLYLTSEGNKIVLLLLLILVI